MDNDGLFALRIYYQDIYNDEINIIKKLKLNLVSRGIEISEVNNILLSE